MKYSHSKAMAGFYKIVKLVKNGVLMMIHIYAKVSIANDILTSSETNTDEAIALGIDISKTANYKEGQLTRFVSLEYKSDLRQELTFNLSHYFISKIFFFFSISFL
jgi:ribosomal protein L18